MRLQSTVRQEPGGLRSGRGQDRGPSYGRGGEL